MGFWVWSWVAPLVLAAVGPDQEKHDESREVLRVGHWVKVMGALDESGVFVASEIELLQPDDKENLVGTVERIVDRDGFMLLGQQVQLSGKTEWKGMNLGDLPGARVRVQGHFRGIRNFVAREVASRRSGRDSVEGRIDRLQPDGPYLQLSIMGFRVLVAADVDVERTESLDTIALAPQGYVAPQGLERNNEEDDVLGTVRLGENVSLGGLLEMEWTRKDNYDLNDSNASDRTDWDVAARLEAVWEPAPGFFALVNTRMTQQWRADEDDGSAHEGSLRIAEFFGYWRNLFGLGWDLQVGRQDFDDPREWIYDQNLDAVRLIRSTTSYRLELAAATTFSDGSPRDESSTDLMAYLSNNSRQRHAAAYVIDRRDRDDSGEHFTHIGGRLLGEWLPQNQSWIEAAGLIGESGGEDLGALGFDIGSTWFPETEWAPALTVGWAWGSGDQEPGSGINGTFRQSGFNDNNDKWSGVTSFRYYGELVEPELANLSIVTLGIGRRLSRVDSLDLVWHRYDQVEPAAQLIHSDLRSKPNGIDSYLGWEADLIFGSRAIPGTQFEIVVGWFDPGDAFPNGDPAWLARAQFRWRF